MTLTGKVAIVTGASRGIGRQIAFELAKAGAAVALAARSVEPRSKRPGTIGETLAAIEADGGRAIAVQTDVADPKDLERLVATTIETFGRLDILVNNAADTEVSSPPIEVMPRALWLRQFDINVHAPFTLMGLAVPLMKAQGGGIIVNITSGAADLVPVSLEPEADGPVRLGAMIGYASTKAALSRLTNAVAPELARQNIAAVAVDPGYTRTEMVDILDEQGFVDADAAHPMAVPVKLVMDVITAGKPLAFAGQVLQAVA